MAKNTIEVVINAVDNASKTLGGFKDNLQSVGKVALGAAGVAAGAVAGIGAGIVKLAADAAPVEGIGDAFAGLTKDMEGGSDRMLAALREGSAGMISNRDIMMSFNKASQLVSKDFAVQLPDAMQYLSKVSAATGEDMGFMMDSLVTGVGRLSPMILDNLGIQVALSEATERASEMFGVEASELTKTQTQAGMMNVVLEKLKDNTADMPDVTQSAAAKMAALKATFQNTKDEIGMAFLPVLNQLLGMALPALQSIVQAVIPHIENFSERLGFLIEYFKGVIQEGDYLNDWLTELPAGIQPVIAFIGELVAAMLQGWEVLKSGQGVFAALMEVLGNFLPDAFIEALWQIYDVVAPIIQSVVQWLGENVKLQDILIAIGIAIASVVLPALWGIIAAAAPLVGTFLLIVAAVAALRTAWETNFLGIRDKALAVWNFLKEFIPRAIEVIRQVVTTVVAAIRDFWAEHGDAILAKGQQVWNAIQTVITTVINTVSAVITTVVSAIRAFFSSENDQMQSKASVVWNTIKTTIETIINTIKNIIEAVMGAVKAFWQANGDNIKTIANAVWTAIKTTVETILNAIKAIIETISNAIKAFWQAYGNDLKAIAQAVWDAIKTYINTVMTVIQSVIAAIASAIKGDWTAFGEHLRTATDAAFNAMKSIIEGVGGAIVSFIGGMVQDVISKFTSIDWGSVGRGIIDGIANGIRGGVDAITNAARNAAQAALDAAKGFLGIGSPSRVFREDIGKQLPAGMAQGILGNMNMPVAAAKQMSQTVYDNSRTYQVSMAPTEYRSVGTIEDDARWAAKVIGATA